MRYIICAFVVIAAMILMGCGDTTFSSTGALSKGTPGDEASGQVRQGGDARGGVEQGACDSSSCDDGDGDGDDDDAGGMIPQPTLEEFKEAIQQDPNERTLYEGAFRCYISHSGGHGVELCQTGDKSVLTGMMQSWKDTRSGEPVEVKGNDLCVRPAFILLMPALFDGATVGSCL